MRFSNSNGHERTDDRKQIRFVTTVKTVLCVRRATAVSAEVVAESTTAPLTEQFMISRAHKNTHTHRHILNYFSWNEVN